MHVAKIKQCEAMELWQNREESLAVQPATELAMSGKMSLDGDQMESRKA